MENTAKKSRLAGIPAWALSAMTLVLLMILLALFEDPKSSGIGNDPLQMFGLISYVVLITAACFIICLFHPKSVYYTPVICNAVGLMGVFTYVFTSLGTLDELIYWGGCIVISVIGAIAGATLGRRRIPQAE